MGEKPPSNRTAYFFDIWWGKMSEYLDEINYDKLIELSLKQVIVEALKIAERQGLPGENHFYITFKTDHPRTQISKGLLAQYPHDMTIVIQHQYSNLIVNKDSFSIDLSFNGIPQTLIIPFDAITYFGDPYAKFGLSFATKDSETPYGNEENEAPRKASGEIASVVSIDAFRKK